MSAYAYELKKLQRHHLIEGQNEAIKEHQFRNFKELGNQVKKIIHGFPRSFQETYFQVQDMEIYIGVALPDQLYKRFKHHVDSKDHEFGIILGTSQSHFANYMEKVGITLLKKLQDHGTLCVRNQVARGHNYEDNENVEPDELIFYYMTIKINIIESNEWIKPNTQIRSEIKEIIISGLSNEDLNYTDKKHITVVVDGVHLASDFAKVNWDPIHRK